MRHEEHAQNVIANDSYLNIMLDMLLWNAGLRKEEFETLGGGAG